MSRYLAAPPLPVADLRGSGLAATLHMAGLHGSGRGAAAAAGRILASGSYTGRDLAATLAILLVCSVVYLASCLVWPYGPCFACRLNRGRNPGSNHRRHGRCKVCRGTGERLRIGTRIIRASGFKGGRWPS